MVLIITGFYINFFLSNYFIVKLIGMMPRLKSKLLCYCSQSIRINRIKHISPAKARYTQKFWKVSITSNRLLKSCKVNLHTHSWYIMSNQIISSRK